MGQAPTKTKLEEITIRAEKRVGKIQVTGRYHTGKAMKDDYEVSRKVLGTGYNGSVLLAQSRTTGAQVAVKAFKLAGVKADKREELMSECEIFLAMDHPHVARLVDVYELEDSLNLVMECMSGGELFNRVVESHNFSERDAADAAWQMLLAVNYIHTHGVVHRDIKLENFLYETKGSNHLKLIDFGFSRIWQPNRKMALSCGTLSYVAPEVLGKSYDSQCDMWSLGVTIFITLFGYMPFSGSEDEQISKIRSGKYTVKQSIWKNVSETGQDFIKTLLVIDPKNRLTPEQALAHPWISQREKLKPETLDQSIVDALCSFGQASTFRRACMSMMAWSLSVEDRSKVRDAFIELDVNRTGAITLAEFKQVLESKFHLEDENIVEVFKSLDTAQTDEIHYSEFLAAMVSSRIALHDNLLKDTFKRFDVDNSGFITVENLRSVLGESFEGAEVDSLLDEADLTRDGRISYNEFIEYMKNGVVADRHMDVAAKVIDTQLRKDDTQGPNPPFLMRLRRTLTNTSTKEKEVEEASGGSKQGQKKCGLCGCSQQ